MSWSASCATSWRRSSDCATLIRAVTAARLRQTTTAVLIQRMPDAISDYVVLCDKPAGVSSHHVVTQVRRGLPRKTKVGHAGTLDPFATGLLLVLVGRATRAQRFLMGLPKTYEATARFGAVSSTGDPEGEIVVTGVLPREPLRLPTGRIRQRPPAYSAVKVGGRRAYELARAGAAVELAEREVEVYRFHERWHDGDRRAFVIECSRGTYVRSLIADLGDAYCEQLRRTRIGDFDVADADPQRPIPLAQALAFIPELRLGGDEARRASHGAAIAAEGRAPAPVVRLTDAQGLIALAQPGPAPGMVKPVVGFR
jgi:tRNA pseudouridine55 synthase